MHHQAHFGLFKRISTALTPSVTRMCSGRCSAPRPRRPETSAVT